MPDNPMMKITEKCGEMDIKTCDHTYSTGAISDIVSALLQNGYAVYIEKTTDVDGNPYWHVEYGR